MTLSIGTKLGGYEILAPLGAGGMGEVYRARDRRLSRDVAIKVLPDSVAADPDRVARFAREAQVLAALNHPNIGHIYGLEEAGRESGSPAAALVMELVEGATLDERMGAGPMPVTDAIPIARQIADALEYAHEQGIIHRDLKPANIKLRPDGTVKLLDFGLAKALETPTSSSGAAVMNSPTLTAHATQAGVILGTAAYMAPEQARGRVVDRRVDIWAFGVVLFEMLSGHRLFDGGSTSEILAAVMRDDPPWDALPATTPPHVRTLLQRSLERDPRLRLRDIGEARVLLERPPEPSVSTLPRVHPRRRRMLWPIVAAVAGVTALAAIAQLFRQPPPAVPASPMQFTIPPPPTAAALNHQSLVLNMAASPDGRYIATVVPDGIWLWSAAAGTARLLEDTAGAAAPFFSPDGNHIAFFAREELRRIAIAGGPASLITRTPAGEAGTWGADDTILYTSWIGPKTGLWRVSARGGEPTLIKPAVDFADLPAFPSFLPDGQHYVFMRGARALTVGQRQICLDSLAGGGEPQCVAHGDSNPVYSASGHLLFVREGTLVALPFDPEQRRATGEAITVARGMRWFGPAGVAMFAVSADGRVLVYVSASRPRRLVWFNRDGRQDAPLGSPAMYNQLQLSPDGKRVAVDVWNPSNGGRDLWTIDVAAGVSTRVTFDPADVYLGSWRPDGRALFFGRPSNSPPDLYEIAADGGGSPRLLFKAPGVQLAQHWSPAGDWLSYIDVRPDKSDHRDVLLLSVEGQTRRLRETPANTFDPRFSPDGRLIAYVSDESGRPEVYVAPLNATGSARRLSRSGGFLPRWRGDGRELFFLQPDGWLVSVDPGLDAPLPQQLFRIDGVSEADGYSPPRERSVLYDVTPDGKRFLLRLTDAAADRSDDLRVSVNWSAGLDRAPRP